MKEALSIAGYCRISVDDDLERDNTSIENQRDIISDYVAKNFPGSALTFYEDRDRSGYTFDQREGYQKMRPMLMDGSYNILVVKDFSRFSRRNSRGLVELEDLRDAGVRIISIGDSIDYPTYDDWTAIQFRFLVNEMPVTDASKKVKSVISRRQEEGRWICAVPYGYVITNTKTMAFEVEPTEAQVVRMIFDLYNEGWGYKKIANHLTAQHIPTPRMSERDRKIAAGEEYKRSVKEDWSLVTVQSILDNDFYIGTLRQGKYTRRKINGDDRKTDESEHIVFENHHDAIVDFRVFSAAQENRKKRTKSNYRGVKKYDNFYSGVLYCGDCGSPMFSMSRGDLKPAYTCGTYHRRGLSGCTSHHIRTDTLDELLKRYVQKVKENSAGMLAYLDQQLKAESIEVKNNEETAEILERQLDDAYQELKATKRMRIRDIMKHPEKEAVLDQTYDELEAELEEKIAGLQHQIEINANKRSAIIQITRIARTALDVFDGILQKEKLDKLDIGFIIDRITVFEDHIDIQLKSDIDALLQCGLEGLEAANFKSGIGDISLTRFVQRATHQKDKVFDVNVINEGAPSLMRRVWRISLGITTRPRESTLRTIPVAFIYISPFTTNYDAIICKRRGFILRNLRIWSPSCMTKPLAASSAHFPEPTPFRQHYRPFRDTICLHKRKGSGKTMEILTYANTARKTIEPYLRMAKQRGLWRIAGTALAGFFLSAASLGAHAMPLALGLLFAAPAGVCAVAAALGGGIGYWVFWREPQGAAWLAAGLLAAAVTSKRPALQRQGLLMPSVAALIVSGCGVIFLLRFGDDTGVNIYLLRILMSMVSSAVLRQWRAEPTGAAGWMVCALSTLSLAQVVPVKWLSLGYAAAGWLGVRCSFPAVAMAGLGLDLAQVTGLPMTGVMCLSFCLRLIPRQPGVLRWGGPAITFLLVSALWGRFDPLPLPGLLLGGVVGSVTPGLSLSSSALRRRGAVGLAQVRLEKAAYTLQKMEQSLLLTSESEPDRRALLRQTADRACDTCPERRNCKTRHLIPGLSVELLEQPGLQTTDLPPGCRKNGRLLTELRRGQEQLRRIKGDRSRRSDYRSALMDQYSFLAEYLRFLSDGLVSGERPPRLRFQPDIGISSRSLEGVCGDRCVGFDGAGSLSYVLLCDGMGTGEGAAGEAREAIALLRQFLEAGFPAEAALRSFNSLCALRGTAGCATVDLLEMDLRGGTAVLYKWGAGVSYLSVAGQLRKVGTATPPPGLSQQARETVERLSLGEEDLLIMLSDGAGAEGLVRPGWTASELSAGEIASAILEQGVQRGDDATVAVVRLVPLGLNTP